MEPNNSETNHIVTIKPDLYWTNVIQEIKPKLVFAVSLSSLMMMASRWPL